MSSSRVVVITPNCVLTAIPVNYSACLCVKCKRRYSFFIFYPVSYLCVVTMLLSLVNCLFLFRYDASYHDVLQGARFHFVVQVEKTTCIAYLVVQRICDDERRRLRGRLSSLANNVRISIQNTITTTKEGPFESKTIEKLHASNVDSLFGVERKNGVFFLYFIVAF